MQLIMLIAIERDLLIIIVEIDNISEVSNIHSTIFGERIPYAFQSCNFYCNQNWYSNCNRI